MYGIFTYIYQKNQPNVGKYTIHGSYGSYENRHLDGRLDVRGSCIHISLPEGTNGTG